MIVLAFEVGALLTILVLLGVAANAYDRWAGGPDQRDARARNRGRRW